MPSIDTNRSICPFIVSPNSAFIAAQVAEPLFADIGDEGDRAGRLHVRLAQGTDDRRQHGEAAAVVADARPPQHVSLARDLDVGVFREHGVEVRRNHDVRRRCCAGPIAEDVAGTIDPDVLQSQIGELALQHFATRGFLEWRRRHLAEANLVLDGAPLDFLGGVQRRPHRRILRQSGDGSRLLGLDRAGDREQDDQCRSGGAGEKHHPDVLTSRGSPRATRGRN